MVHDFSSIRIRDSVLKLYTCFTTIIQHLVASIAFSIASIASPKPKSLKRSAPVGASGLLRLPSHEGPALACGRCSVVESRRVLGDSGRAQPEL